MKAKVCFKHEKINRGEGWRTVKNLIAELKETAEVAFIEECPRCWKEKQTEKEYWEELKNAKQ